MGPTPIPQSQQPRELAAELMAAQLGPKAAEGAAQRPSGAGRTPVQWDLLNPARQLTLEGRSEPLPAAPAPPEPAAPEPVAAGQLELGAPKQLPLRIPKWIRACQRGAWHLALRNRGTGERVNAPFRCHSWRHRGDCARWVASRDFVRINAALGDARIQDVVVMVLTLHQRRDQASGLDAARAYVRIRRRWQSLRQRLAREFGEPIRYVATIEQHRSGWPHLNVILVSRSIARAVRGSLRRETHLSRAGARVTLAPDWLVDAARGCGFGPICTADGMHGSREALAGYVVKIAHMDSLKRGPGEVVKLSQLPISAPPGTRRLRSSRYFLPPAYRGTGEWEGGLSMVPLEIARRMDSWMKGIGAAVVLASGGGTLVTTGTSYSEARADEGLEAPIEPLQAPPELAQGPPGPEPPQEHAWQLWKRLFDEPSAAPRWSETALTFPERADLIRYPQSADEYFRAREWVACGVTHLKDRLGPNGEIL